jgi:hypothetical protein
MKTNLDVNDIREGVVAALPGVEGRFTIYYDETNNIRKLYLTETGFNVTKHENFVLGGIALKEGQAIPDIADLRRTLVVQKTATELKLRHIASGKFEDMLASEKMLTFLSWLSANDICIHFSNINILYWALVDIVDAIILTEKFQRYIPAHKEMKNELYRLVSCDTPGFLTLLRVHGFPDIAADRGGDFLAAVEAFLGGHVSEEPNLPTLMLMALIREAKSLDELTFEAETEGMIIASFDKFFLQPICNFKNAFHIFDREVEVERAIARYRLMDGGREVNFRFSDSKAEVGIQLSDVVVGFLGKYFMFIEENSMCTLLTKKAHLTATQAKCLALLRGLIDVSDAVSPALCHRVATMDSDWKANAFLFDQPPPPHLL